MTTRQLFDRALEELNDGVFELGNLINLQIEKAEEALLKQDRELAKEVIDGDALINEKQTQIEGKSMLLMATQQPSAKDLRKIVAAFKISIFLERMGDLAVDIAKTSQRMDGEKMIQPLTDIARMAEIVRIMLEEGLAAYRIENLEDALKMAKMDDEVDRYYHQIFRELLLITMENPKNINQATYLIFAARFFERIGDYCTNIAEEVQYIVTAERTDMN